MTIYVVVTNGGGIISAHRTYDGAYKACLNKPHLKIEIVFLTE